MTEIRPRRSVLAMPGSNPRLLEKARTLPTDVVMIDLEDSAAPESRAATREAVARAVSEGGFGSREVLVRINSLDTPYGEADLAAIAPAGPDASPGGPTTNSSCVDGRSTTSRVSSSIAASPRASSSGPSCSRTAWK
jgi:hypothetical protein